MANRKPVGKDKVSIPKSFFIPEGVDEFTYERELEDEYEEFSEIGEDEESVEPVYTITIVSQKIRKTEKGKNVVVDVVVEVEDSTGADDYELRIAPV